MTTQKGKIGVEEGIFDNFALDCFRSCPQYYEWRILKGVIKPAARRTAAEFGTAIHSALEHYYKKGMTDESIREALEIFAQTFKEDVADDKRTIFKGLEILSNYFMRYRIEPFKVAATEIGGAVELGDYLYTVRIDLLLDWQSPPGKYGMDHKTTSSLYRMVVKPSNQVCGYEFFLRETYENVLGYIVNSIGVYKSTEEMDKSVPKVKSKTGRMIYAQKEREIFLRLPTSHTKVEIENWKKETIHWIHQIETCQEANIWPKHAPSYCTAFASKCQFLDLCQAQDKEILKPLLEAEVYKTEPWVPYQGMTSGEEEEGGEGA